MYIYIYIYIYIYLFIIITVYTLRMVTIKCWVATLWDHPRGQSAVTTVTLRQSKMASWQIPELNGAFDRNMIELNEKKVQCFIPALSDRLCEFLVFSRPKNCCHLQPLQENQHPTRGSSSKARPVQHMENLMENLGCSWKTVALIMLDHAGSSSIMIPWHLPTDPSFCRLSHVK